MRRPLILLSVLGLLTGACGGDADDTAVLSVQQEAVDDASEPTAAEAAEDGMQVAASDEPAAEPAPALPVTVVDADGEEVVVEDTSRIVSLTGTTTEILHALGVFDRIVAVDTTSTTPVEATELPDVGYQRQLNAEGIIAMDPTLVLGTEAAGPPEVLDQLVAAGITTLRLSHPDGLDTPAQRIRDIATAVGVPERGEQLAAEVEADIAAVMADAAARGTAPRAAFIIFRGPEALFLGGSGTASQVMLEAAGAIDAGADTGVDRFVPLTPEALVAAAPDVIVTTTASLRAAGGVEGVLELPGVAQTPAGEAGRVVAADDGPVLGLGLRTPEALAVLVEGLHGPAS